MAYKSLQQCITDLEKQGELLRIPKQVNPDLEMAGMQLDEFAKGGKAIIFENIKGSKFRAASNLFGTLERSKFMFRNSLKKVKQLIDLKTNPALDTYGVLAKELHPLVLGDELVKVLKLIISFCLSHKHTPQQPPYASSTEQELIDLNALLDEDGINISTILSKSVRTN